MIRESRYDPVSEQWYYHAFGDLYPIIYAHRSIEAAKPEALFAARVLGLLPNERVLDLCCGNGRHLVHLEEMGVCASGLDYSAPLLALARKAVACPRLVRADMRRIPFSETFDAVLNFFTSFGYFLDPEDNEAVAQGVAGALKCGGRFFIDYLNPANVVRTLTPESVRVVEDYEIQETRWIDAASQRVNKSTKVSRGGSVVHRSTESVRLYSLDELRALMGRCGLVVERVFGGYDGSVFGADAERMILVGRRALR